MPKTIPMFKCDICEIYMEPAEYTKHVTKAHRLKEGTKDEQQ